MAVEKLLSVKFAKIKLRQDALQTILSIFLDIFYPPNFRCFEENGLFQHPRLFSPVTALSKEQIVEQIANRTRQSREEQRIAADT